MGDIKFSQLLILIVSLVLVTTMSFNLVGGGTIDKIYVAPMSHLDIGFTATQQQVARKYKYLIDSALRQVERYPDYRWTIESFWQLKAWLERTEDQQKIEKLVRLIREDQIELGGAFANMHTNFMSGETFLRFLYPARHFASKYNLKIQTVIQNDVPGYSQDLATVLTNANVDYFVTGINATLHGGFNLDPAQNPFYWKAPNGEKVLTWVSSTDPYKGYWGGFKMLWGEWLAGKKFPTQIEDLLKTLQRQNYPYDSILMLRAMDNKSPQAPNLIKRVQEWNRNHKTEMVISTPTRFMRHMESSYGDQFPTFSGGWPLWGENKAGSPVTSARTRWLQERLSSVETIDSLASVRSSSPPSPAELDRIYKKILFSDAHSSAGGPSWPGKLSIRQVKTKNRAIVTNARRALKSTRTLLDSTLTDLSRQFVAGNPRIFVFNSQLFTDWELFKTPIGSDLAKKLLNGNWKLIDLSSGTSASYQIRRTKSMNSANPWREPSEGAQYLLTVSVESVPEMGYKLYEFIPTQSAVAPWPQTLQSDGVIKNKYYEVKIGDSGFPTIIKDLLHGRQLVNHEAQYKFGQPLVGGHSDSYRRTFHGDPVSQAVEGLEEVHGSVTHRLTVNYSNGPLITAEIVLYDDAPWIDFRYLIDRSKLEYVPYEKHSSTLYLSFPFSVGKKGLVEGPLSFKTPRSFMPGAETGRSFSRGLAQFYEKDYAVTISHRQSFVSTMGGSHNRIKGGAPPRVPDQPALWISELLKKFDETKAMGGIAEFDPEPGASDRIWFEYRVTSFVEPQNRVKLTRFREKFLDPLSEQILTGVTSGGESSDSSRSQSLSQSFFRVEGKVNLVTFKIAEDGTGYILKLRNPTRQSQQVSISSPIPVASIWEVDGLERKPGQLTADWPLNTMLGPNELKSFLLTWNR